MRYYLLLVLIFGAAYAFASLLVAASASLLWPAIRRRLDRPGAAAARLVAGASLAPCAVGAMVAAVLAAAFIRFEPGNTSETPGVLLSLGAAVAAAMALWAAVRITRAARAGARCSRVVRSGARALAHADGTRIWVLDTEYPIAAVVGVFKTRLLLSTRVIEECTEAELDAIVKHERAHVRRHDNLVRAAMLYLPNPLAFLTTGREMHQTWAAAAEEAADDAAAGNAAESRTTLASALVRVAKMATTPAPDWVGGLAFYEGSNLENRVRRLLRAGSGATQVGVRSSIALAALILCCALLLTNAAAVHLHAWMELVVQVAP